MLSAPLTTGDMPSPLAASLPRWQCLLAAAFPSAVTVQLALQLYVANEAQLANAAQELLWLLLGCLGLWALLAVALRWFGRLGKLPWALACSATIFFLVRDLAFPLPLAPLDGSHAFPKLGIAYRVGEYAVLLVALGLLLWLRLQQTTPITAVAALVFATAGLCTVCWQPAVFGWAAGAGSADHPEVTFRTASTPRGARLDVYQILFDEYQTVEHQYVRQERGSAPFDDFICFRNNISNYNHTWLSLPSLFTGVDYSSDQDCRDWYNSFRNEGLLRTLKECGYAIRVFGYNQFWDKASLADYSRSSRQTAVERFAGRSNGDFLTLVALRTLPSRTGAHIYHRWRQAMWDREVPPMTQYAYYSTLNFRELVRGIKHTQVGGNYTFAHLILPHGPFLVDEKGEYVGEDRASRMSHVYCVDQLVGELVAELKRLGRYEQSLIIVHADTGAYYEPDLASQQIVNGRCLRPAPTYNCWTDGHICDGARWPISIIRARTNAALLIKPPGHRGYRVVDAPSQLKDIAPTILGVIGAAEAAAQFPDGTDLLSNPPGPDRVRKTFVYGTRMGGEPARPHLQEYIIRNGNYERGRLVPFTGKPF